MQSSARFGLALIVFGALFAFAGCGDDDSSTDGAGGTAHGGSAAGGEPAAAGAGGAAADTKCEEIAELCHPVDDGDGPLHDCHIGAEAGNAERCAASYADCFALCTAAHEALEGGGGAGGTGAGGAAAGGVTSVGGAAVGGAGGAP